MTATKQLSGFCED